MEFLTDNAALTLGIVDSFLRVSYCNSQHKIIMSELLRIQDSLVAKDNAPIPESFDELQYVLSDINEFGEKRRSKGVYYTPEDVVDYMVANSMKLYISTLGTSNIHQTHLDCSVSMDKCTLAKVLDPTCGVGGFLVSFLNLKFDLHQVEDRKIAQRDVLAILGSIHGNDISEESTTIAKVRLFLVVLERFGVDSILGIADILNNCFTNFDFIEDIHQMKDRFDIIIGNPPYVEDTKSHSLPTVRYGNIYANVLDNSSELLNASGVMGFVIPLSYVATPRMKGIREKISSLFNEQYLLNFSDRPDSLFSSVHQKLTILLAKKNSSKKGLYSSQYNYWYKQERGTLFEELKIVLNPYSTRDYIPKLGSHIDLSIYQKVSCGELSLHETMLSGNVPLYLNMRATFWIKVFTRPQKSAEYKIFLCHEDMLDYLVCLLSSTLFWWFWICVSDCWHITQKDLRSFYLPAQEYDKDIVRELANELNQELLKTRIFVGTKQTEYEYKHKNCLSIIHKIDDYITNLYGLTEEEIRHIKEFALRYRVGGGPNNESH